MKANSETEKRMKERKTGKKTKVERKEIQTLKNEDREKM